MRFFNDQPFKQIPGDLFLNIIFRKIAKNQNKNVFEIKSDRIWEANIIDHRINNPFMQFNVFCLKNPLFKKRRK